MYDLFGAYLWIVLIVQATIFGIASSYLADQKNKGKGTWFFIGFFLGIIGLIMIAASKTEDKSIQKSALDTHQTVRSYVDKSKKIISPIKYIDLEAPVEVHEVGINLEEGTNRVYLAVEFRNLSNKPVSGIKFTAYCYDSFGDPVASPSENELNLTIQDISVESKALFGGTKYYPIFEYPSTRLVDIVINLVSFNDGTTWRRGDNILKENTLIPIGDEDKLSNLKVVAGNDAVTYPSEDSDTWVCVCGRLNKKFESECVRCSRLKEIVFKNYNKLSIEEEVIRLEEIKKSEQKATKRKSKRIMVILALVIILVVPSAVLLSRYQQEKVLEIDSAKQIENDTKQKSVRQKVMELLAAFDNKDNEEAKILLNELNNVNYNVNYKESEGNNLLQLAIINGLDYEIIEMLLNQGAETNMKNSFGNTPLHTCVSKFGTTDYKVLVLLLENGADVDTRNTDGKTALHLASLNSTGIDLMEILLEYNADPNIRNNSNETLLHELIWSDEYDMIELLLKNGADPNLKDGNGPTPLDIVESNQFIADRERLIDLLVSYGAR